MILISLFITGKRILFIYLCIPIIENNTLKDKLEEMDELKCYGEKISYLESSEFYIDCGLGYDEETDEEFSMPSSSDHGVVFPHRYNKNEIKFPKAYKDYLDNINIQMSVEALGLDIEKFWFYILYTYDLSEQKTQNITPTKDSAKTQYRNFIDALDSAFELDDNKQFVLGSDGYAKLKKEVVIEIKIDGKKQKAIINNKHGLQMLSHLMDVFLSDVEDGSLFDTETRSARGMNSYNESPTTKNYLIITYFKTLFEYLKKDLRKGKTDLYNKNILIAEVLRFMHLIEEEQTNEDYIKNTLKYYKNKTINSPIFCPYY